ncbi:conjugal transfer pilin signal peptidase TrbI [Hephaestia caeni]|uniref:Conjugal transfer pilin signal peptidase TrbI n=1 Tax=Hephaestia caeni TaxID=645617 RepID=A0A397PCY5_9SPHN|nr:S26 family signal peptidase [Hephaestia caeni]RIA46273.1 conjugal transfer pilin signal peptidase TrbI [Hephaestia caeni]
MQPSGEPPAWRRRRWLLAGLILIGGIGVSALAAWREEHALLINASESLPNWAFAVNRNKAPARGDYLFFVPPPSDLVRTHFGEKPGTFGKIVQGMPGDIVEHRGADVLVGGHVVARMKKVTRRGEKLVPGPVGRIPEGCYFVATPHPDGFDSRYAAIGFVCRPQILGTGEAVL